MRSIVKAETFRFIEDQKKKSSLTNDKIDAKPY